MRKSYSFIQKMSTARRCGYRQARHPVRMATGYLESDLRVLSAAGFVVGQLICNLVLGVRRTRTPPVARPHLRPHSWALDWSTSSRVLWGTTIQTAELLRWPYKSGSRVLGTGAIGRFHWDVDLYKRFLYKITAQWTTAGVKNQRNDSLSLKSCEKYTCIHVTWALRYMYGIYISCLGRWQTKEAVPWSMCQYENNQFWICEKLQRII